MVCAHVVRVCATHGSSRGRGTERWGNAHSWRSRMDDSRACGNGVRIWACKGPVISNMVWPSDTLARRRSVLRRPLDSVRTHTMAHDRVRGSDRTRSCEDIHSRRIHREGGTRSGDGSGCRSNHACRDGTHADDSPCTQDTRTLCRVYILICTIVQWSWQSRCVTRGGCRGRWVYERARSRNVYGLHGRGQWIRAPMEKTSFQELKKPQWRVRMATCAHST